MVRKSFESFLFFVVLYAFFVFIYPCEGVGTHQWQENQIKAQKFLYEHHTDSVIVGTSLSARILLDSVPMITSCSYSACVVEDGLRMILAKDTVPQVVLIESNYFLRSSNGELVRVNTKGIIPWLRHFIPLLREYNSPICFLGAYFMRDALSPSEIVDTVRLSANIKQRISEDHTHILTERQVEERLAVIMPLIHEIETRGAKLVFFEMPLNERLVHLTSNDQTRQVVNQMFPSDRYVYLPIDTARYLTNDGEHLDLNGQYRFSSFIRKALANI